MKDRKFTEAEIINFLRQEFTPTSLEVRVGIGDDTAVIKKNDYYWLLTKDLLLENVHFLLAAHPPFLLGRKSLNVNVSDVAAMGGRPRWCLLGLGISNKVGRTWLKEFLAGFKTAAREAGIELLGGDLSRSTRLFISVTLIGESKSPVLREGARPGDILYVSGSLGEAALGLQLLKKGHRLGENPGLDYFLKRFLDPAPPLHLGQEIARAGFVSAMIDLSDGLSTDVHHLCQASNCGAEIWRERLPLSSELNQYAAQPLRLALHGGEDYQLLFAVKSEAEKSFLDWQKKNNSKLYPIGRLTKEKNVYLVGSRGQKRILQPRGFRHFD